MHILLWSLCVWGAPEGNLGASHFIQYTPSEYRQDTVIRGHIALEDGPFKSDVWVEVHQPITTLDKRQWLLRPQRLTWNNDHLRIGYQIHRWGLLDVLSAADLLAPKDMRWGPLTPLELSRMANPSLTATLGQDKWRHQASLHVGPASNAISFTSTPFAIFPTTAQAEFWADVSTYSADPLGEAVWPVLLETAERTLNSAPFSLQTAPQSQYPIDLSWRSDWSTRQRNIGVGLAWLRSRMPTIEVAPEIVNAIENTQFPEILTLPQTLSSIEAPIRFSQPQLWHYALWYSQLIGGVGLRAEGSFQQNIPYQTSAFEWSSGHQLQGGLGLDRMFSGNFVVSGEHRVQYLHSIDPVKGYWLKAPLNNESAFSQQFFALQQRLNAQATMVYNWTFSELLSRLEISWRFQEEYKASIGVLNLIGKAPEDYLDRIGYKGGEIGYFSNGDTVFGRLEWVY